jgi:hypothetical protein
MKGSIAVAIATGTLVVVAYGGFAMASEVGDPSDPVVAITTTEEPEESSDEDASEDDAPSSDAPAEENGLVCVLVPIEPVDEEPTADEPTADEPTAEESTEGEATAGESTGDEPTESEPLTIEQVLAANDIECTGTGNERSSEVALVPRYLAHSDEFTGAEKGAAISAWAKTHANKKSEDDEVVDDGEEASGDVTESSEVEPSSPGRSGDAPGHSGSNPGNGHGR